MVRKTALSAILVFICWPHGGMARADVGFADGFESYTAGAPLPAPWCDWDSGNPPVAGTTVVYGGGAGGSNKYFSLGDIEESGHPIRWFANPLDAKNRIVDISFSFRGSSWMGISLGSMEGGPGTPQPWNQNQYSIGFISANAASLGQATYQDQVLSNLDPNSWNVITVRLIARSTSALKGQGELFVNGVGTGIQSTWTLSSEGLSGIDIEGLGDLDNISVVQNGFADPLPAPAAKSYYPGVKSLQGGGIGSDGSRYVYAMGGTDSGELYRYDASDNTWTKLASRAAAPDYYESHGVALTTNGKIVVASGWSRSTPKDFYEYDIANNTWSGPISPSQPPYLDNYAPQVAAAGTRVFGAISPGYEGFVQYDAAGGTFLTGQGSFGSGGAGATPPGGWAEGGAFAYAGGKYLYRLTQDPNTSMGAIVRWDITKDPTLDNWDALETLASLPVEFPGSYESQSALTYVPANFSSLYILHQDEWDTGLYEVRVQGGALLAALDGSSDLYRYDIDTDTWTTLVGALAFTFAAGDDITSGLLLTGDTNADGVVDVNDLNNVCNNLGSTGPDLVGDTNGDGVVDVNDLNNAYNSLGRTNSWYEDAGSAQVPEPLTTVLLTLGLAWLMRRRRCSDTTTSSQAQEG